MFAPRSLSKIDVDCPFIHKCGLMGCATGGTQLRRKYPAHPIVGVGAVVVHEGRLLLVRRGAEPDKGGWTVPGGVLELGEKVREATVREAKEECSIEIEIVDDKPVDMVDNIVVGENGRVKYHYSVLLFLARFKGGNPRPASDVQEVRWVPLEEVEECKLTKGFRTFFEKHRSKLEF